MSVTDGLEVLLTLLVVADREGVGGHPGVADFAVVTLGAEGVFGAGRVRHGKGLVGRKEEGFGMKRGDKGRDKGRRTRTKGTRRKKEGLYLLYLLAVFAVLLLLLLLAGLVFWKRACSSIG